MPVKLSYLSTKETRHQSPPPVVLIHGWGCDSTIWGPLPSFLNRWTEVIMADISYDDSPIDQVVKIIVKQLPEQFILCGWSLGGMLATRIAAQYPEKTRALITLASNTTFIANEDWADAMEPKTFDTFYTLFKRSPQSALKRFVSLQALGDKQSRQQGQWLQHCFNNFTDSTQSLQYGLHWLKNTDNTGVIASIKVPALYIFGEKDALVPQSTAQKILRHSNIQQTTTVLPKRGHLLHYPTDDIEPILTSFFSQLTSSD